jgi:hypothetical protein
MYVCMQRFDLASDRLNGSGKLRAGTRMYCGSWRRRRDKGLGGSVCMQRLGISDVPV